MYLSVIEKLPEGVIARDNEEEFLLPEGQLDGAKRTDRKETLRKLKVGSKLDALPMRGDDGEWDRSLCSDGKTRRKASQYHARKAQVCHRNGAAALAWGAKGEQEAVVVTVEAKRGYVLVQPVGEEFLALLNIQRMTTFALADGVRQMLLKEDDLVVVRLLEVRDKKKNAQILVEEVARVV